MQVEEIYNNTNDEINEAEFIEGSRFQNINLVSRLVQLEQQLLPIFKKYRQERRENFNRVGGEIYSAADLRKLADENRPDFVYNYLVPFILKLGGAFKSGAKKLEVRPNTSGDEDLATVATKLLDWIHYAENDVQNEHAKAYLDALIGRIGWLVSDWSFENDELGQVRIKRYDGDRLMCDPTFTQRDTSDMKYILDGNWMTPEEIQMMYARDDDEMWYEIDYWAKSIIGEDSIKPGRLAVLAERVWGMAKTYIGKKMGFDSANDDRTGMSQTGEYYNASQGLFKVLELHERRTELRWIIKSETPVFDINTGKADYKEFDITEAINAKLDGSSWDADKLEQVKQKYIDDTGKGYSLEKRIVNQIYQTTVIPSFNMVVYDEPYAVQNGLFKFVPVFCFDFDIDPLNNKSYVDLMTDPVSSYNLRRNTNLTILMKTAKGGFIYETGALVAGKEDDFHSNEVGANKEVAQGGLSKIKPIETGQIPVAEERYAQEDKASLKEMSGIGPSSMGLKESANESGKAVAERGQQSDEMQFWPQENALGQLIIVGRNTLAIASRYMTVKRVFQVANDEDNPFWLAINEMALNELTGETYLKNDMSKVGQYKVTLGTVPFGEREKTKQFQQTMIVAEALASISPELVSPHILVKSSPVVNKREWLAHIDMIMGKADQMQQKQILQDIIEQNKSEVDFEMMLKEREQALVGTQMQNETTKMNVDFNKLIQTASGIGA